jgi:hypothetical protein
MVLVHGSSLNNFNYQSKRSNLIFLIKNQKVNEDSRILMSGYRHDDEDELQHLGGSRLGIQR